MTGFCAVSDRDTQVNQKLALNMQQQIGHGKTFGAEIRTNVVFDYVQMIYQKMTGGGGPTGDVGKIGQVVADKHGVGKKFVFKHVKNITVSPITMPTRQDDKYKIPGGYQLFVQDFISWFESKPVDELRRTIEKHFKEITRVKLTDAEIKRRARISNRNHLAKNRERVNKRQKEKYHNDREYREKKIKYILQWKKVDRPRTHIPKHICKCCAQKVVGFKRYGGICAQCDKEGIKMPRTEHQFMSDLTAVLGIPASSLDTTVRGEGCKDLERRRPDAVYVSPNRDVVVVVEIDEDSHASREASCENAKISQQNEAIQRCEGLENVPVYTLRVNPDAYDGGRVTRVQRVARVAERIRDILASQNHECNGFQTVEYFYYHSKAEHLIREQAKFLPVKNAFGAE